MFKWSTLALAATLGLLGVHTARAQVEQDPVARLNQLGRYAGRATICGEFGFNVHQERVEAYANSAIALGARAGFSENLSYTYLKNAMDNAMRQAQADIKAMAAGDSEDEAALAQNVRAQARKIVGACREVARDPAGRTIVTDSPLSDDILVRDATDVPLMPTGYASWQTPYMRAGADMIQAVALCKPYLTRAQSDAYVAELYTPNRFPPAVEDKARAYFEFWKSRDELSDMKLDATQCNRLLTGRAATLKAAR